jgi:hypothetical protein
VTPTTRVHIVPDAFRIVLCIDLAPALHAIDTDSGLLLFDHVFRTSAIALLSLLLPLQLPHSTLVCSMCKDPNSACLLTRGFCLCSDYFP